MTGAASSSSIVPRHARVGTRAGLTDEQEQEILQWCRQMRDRHGRLHHAGRREGGWFIKGHRERSMLFVGGCPPGRTRDMFVRAFNATYQRTDAEDGNWMPWQRIEHSGKHLGDMIAAWNCTGNKSPNGQFAYFVFMNNARLPIFSAIHAYHGRLWTGLPPILYAESNHVMVVPWDLKMNDMLKAIPYHHLLTQWCPALVWEAWSILTLRDEELEPSSLRFSGISLDRPRSAIIRPGVLNRFSGAILCQHPDHSMPGLTEEEWAKLLPHRRNDIIIIRPPDTQDASSPLPQQLPAMPQTSMAFHNIQWPVSRNLPVEPECEPVHELVMGTCLVRPPLPAHRDMDVMRPPAQGLAMMQSPLPPTATNRAMPDMQPHPAQGSAMHWLDPTLQTQ